ncbi:hypothetical protein HYALB_00006413 [Hymenoscyphus albidus]|uniref:C2H2-type domain-containing protein n=1 Tax=Hymenoscyphus albidus TaxID=595503 RepID=A0A9N9LLT2_9HELO|nr:hypothetical protein HYALB_00006413 [Hymenoscyphus albidus]
MAPATACSASMSSSSTTNSKCSADNITKKKFGCTFPNCGKSFSRSEHLHRHALNHKDGNNTCLRCSAHFRRRDLLDRHMARHKEKDDEAGGEGLGVLATRKRLWRDDTGKIVNSRRPSYTQEGTKRRQTTRPERKLSKASSTTSSYDEPPTPMTRTSSMSSPAILQHPHHNIPSFSRREDDPKPELTEPDWLSISTTAPLETPQLEEASPTELSSFDALYEDTTWSSLSNEPILSTSPHSSTSLSSLSSSASSPMLSPATSHRPHEYPTPTWTPLPQGHHSSHAPAPFQTFMGAMAELPYDDIFKPEASLYDWQAWNSQVLMSKVREEKYDPLFSSTATATAPALSSSGEEKKPSNGGWLGADAFRRPFAGLSGIC